MNLRRCLELPTTVDFIKEHLYIIPGEATVTLPSIATCGHMTYCSCDEAPVQIITIESCPDKCQTNTKNGRT